MLPRYPPSRKQFRQRMLSILSKPKRYRYYPTTCDRQVHLSVKKAARVVGLPVSGYFMELHRRNVLNQQRLPPKHWSQALKTFSQQLAKLGGHSNQLAHYVNQQHQIGFQQVKQLDALLLQFEQQRDWLEGFIYQLTHPPYGHSQPEPEESEF